MLPNMAKHPLQQTLAHCQPHYPYLAVRMGAANGLGWVTTPVLAQSPDALRHVIAQMGQRMGTTDRPYLTSMMLINHLGQVGAAGILAILVDRRLPMLGTADVAMRYGAAGDVRELALLGGGFFGLPDDPDVEHCDVRVVEDEAILWAYLSRQIEVHAEQLIPPLNAITAASGAKLGPRALWLMLADQIASQAIYLTTAVGRAGRNAEIVAALVGRDGSSLKGKTGVLTIEAGGKRGDFVQRSSCCFIYRAKDGAGRPLNRCQTCPIYSLDDRRHRLAAYLGSGLSAD